MRLAGVGIVLSINGVFEDALWYDDACPLISAHSAYDTNIVASRCWEFACAPAAAQALSERLAAQVARFDGLGGYAARRSVHCVARLPTRKERYHCCGVGPGR